MLELLFVLVVIYVAYVLTGLFVDKSVKKVEPITHKVTISEPTKVIETPIQPKVKKAVVSTTKKVSSGMSQVLLKNPKNTETAKIASSYRMTKRWIKEALVEEGLVDKIYKISEVEANQKQITEALTKLTQLEKYQA